MSDYYDYLDKRTATRPVATRQTMKAVVPRQQLDEPTEPELPMLVEESTASETLIARVKAFWRN